MKNIFSLIILLTLLLPSSSIYSQKTAMDFEQDECGGASNHLFAQLDAGNVVILEFVMLNCAPCILGTQALESITAPYEVSNPGRVHIYSFGFMNSYTCDQILAWKSNNEFTHPVFAKNWSATLQLRNEYRWLTLSVIGEIPVFRNYKGVQFGPKYAFGISVVKDFCL